MWNPIKKVKKSVSSATMGMMQKIAMKKLQNMSPEDQQKLAEEAFKPENRKKLLEAMEQMKKSGQITEAQYRMARQKMGIR